MVHRYTFNKLRQELKDMTVEDKQQRLKELQTMLMAERGKERGHAFFGAQSTPEGSHVSWVLRREIAMVKTSLNVKGFHYYPRT